MFWTALGEVQLLLLPSLLLGGCAAKAARFIRAGSIDAALGPTALFPMRLRRPASIAICVTEFGLGIGLILTAGRLGAGDPAKLIRLGTGLLFVVATAALIELRSVHPDTGCGCFGELSSAPVDDRAVTRSALLALAALESARLPAIELPRTAAQAGLVFGLFAAELAVLAMISPEVKEALVRLGYSEPCEIRQDAPGETLAALKHSVEWGRHSTMLASERPSDTWRELCWRYLAFPGAYPGRETEVVFAIYLESRHAVVHSVLVDSRTGEVIDWPSPATKRWWSWLPGLARRAGAGVGAGAGSAGSAARRAALPSMALSSARTRKP